jgi:hypothetical protein
MILSASLPLKFGPCRTKWSFAASDANRRKLILMTISNLLRLTQGSQVVAVSLIVWMILCSLTDCSENPTQGTLLPDKPSIIKRYLKLLAIGIALVFAFPCALLSGFGRLKPVFTFFAHTFALAPGVLGDYIRIAFYRLTLKQCPLHSRVSFGSFFANPMADRGRGVYIGS